MRNCHGSDAHFFARVTAPLPSNPQAVALRASGAAGETGGERVEGVAGVVRLRGASRLRVDELHGVDVVVGVTGGGDELALVRRAGDVVAHADAQRHVERRRLGQSHGDRAGGEVGRERARTPATVAGSGRTAESRGDGQGQQRPRHAAEITRASS